MFFDIFETFLFQILRRYSLDTGSRDGYIFLILFFKFLDDTPWTLDLSHYTY
jgi:carbohydrate-binding DOMON domain-containing protein